MIAHAKHFQPRRASQSVSQSSFERRFTSADFHPKPTAQKLSDAERKSILSARRLNFFARPIEFIPCRQFSRPNAEKLATVAPHDASVPLRIETAGPKGYGSANQALTPYLASLYQTRLISKDEEQFYFRRMNWLKFRTAKVRKKMNPRRATLKQIDRAEGWLTEAETVKAILVTSNLRLVVSIAKKFVDITNSFEELVSDGNVALIRAVEKFNFALGNRFSTYATYAIQRHFYRMSQKGRQLRTRFVCDDESLRSKPSDPPSADSCSPAQIDVLKQFFGQFLAELEPREKEIVVARFGFDGNPPRTFRELGAEMGVCKERIRQIQGRAMEKLREMASVAKLDQTVDNWL